MFMARVLAAFVPMRMNKSGTQTINQTTAVISSWTADAAYPGTDITTNANKLTMNSADPAKTVTAAVQYSGGTNGYGLSAILYKNGVQIGTTQSSTTSAATLNFTVTGVAIAVGDTFELRGTNSFFGATVQPAGTFIKVE